MSISFLVLLGLSAVFANKSADMTILPTCFAYNDAASLMWDFSSSYNDYYAADFLYAGDTRSAFLRFCRSVDVIYGSIDQDHNPSNWLGYFHGYYSYFSYDAGAGRPDFVMTFNGGDSGRPCTLGRLSTLAIYCTNGDMKNACPSGKCYDGSTNSSCLCSGGYDPVDQPCNASLIMSMPCPEPQLISNPYICPTDDGDDCVNGGEVFGLLIAAAVFFFALYLIFMTIYNCRAEGKSGLSAVPGYEGFQKCINPNYSSIA